ncbi:MAG: hypothetical protein KBT11_04985 [Treponema sp.]|nr:hypothetical protein [Candidatus Treponema equifaecale]
MTLKIRNQLLKTFFYISVVTIGISILTLVVCGLTHRIITPPELRIPAFLNSIPLAKNSLIATFLGIGILLFYIPITLFFINRFFENTQSTEIVFFGAFLIGCLCEVSRFFTISFGVWQTFTNLLIFLGNIVLFGRILTPLSLVCASILSEKEQRQDEERNFLLMVTSAIVFAFLIPMNTARISSTGLVTEGFMGLLNAVRVLLVILSMISFYIRSVRHSNKEYIHLGHSQMALYFGYTLLISTDNFLYLIFGAGLLGSGTYFYLKNLHKMYMWA